MTVSITYIFQKAVLFNFWTVKLKNLKTEYFYIYVVIGKKEECNTGVSYSRTLAVMILHRVTTTTTFRHNIVVVYWKKGATNHTDINM